MLYEVLDTPRPQSVDKTGCHSPKPHSFQLSSSLLLVFLDLKHWLCAFYNRTSIPNRNHIPYHFSGQGVNCAEEPKKLHYGIGTRSGSLCFLIDSLPKTVNAFLYFCFSFCFDFGTSLSSSLTLSTSCVLWRISFDFQRFILRPLPLPLPLATTTATATTALCLHGCTLNCRSNFSCHQAELSGDLYHTVGSPDRGYPLWTDA